MSISTAISTCLICYKHLDDNDFGYYSIYGCSECGQQYHFDHLKSWVIRNKNCPNCRAEMFIDNGRRNSIGTYIACREGFHLSSVNRNRLTCIRCAEPINIRQAVGSELKSHRRIELSDDQIDSSTQTTGSLGFGKPSLYNLVSLKLVAWLIWISISIYGVVWSIIKITSDNSTTETLILPLTICFWIAFVTVTQLLLHGINPQRKKIGFEI